MTKRIEHDLWQEAESLEVVITHDHPVELDQATTIVKVSEEGIILYFYLNGDLNGMVSMTYEEWFGFSQRQLATTKEES